MTESPRPPGRAEYGYGVPWEYRIRAYYPPNKGGGLAIETVHQGASSRDMEISVFKDRMKRREISHIDVIYHVEPYGVYRLYGMDGDPELPKERQQ